MSPLEIEMPSPPPDRGTVALLAALTARGELPEAVRARIALDLLASLPAEDGSVDARSGQSRLHLGAVRVPPSGRAYLAGSGDATGAGVLVWEIFAGREAPPTEERPRLHDAVDEVHADVDDAVNAALDGELATIGELCDAMNRAVPRPASHFDVVASLRAPEDGPMPTRPSVPWPRPPSVVPAARDLLGDLDADLLAPSKGPASDPADVPLVLLCTNDEDDPLAAELRRAGFLVWAEPPSADGAEAVALARPRCVVCDVELEGAHELVEALRGHEATRETPLLLLAPRVDDRSSLAALFATADVCMEKPYRTEAVATQVGALVRKRARLAPSPGSSAIRGDLTQVTAATILRILDLEQRTGELRVDARHRRVLIELASGCVVRASIDGESAVIRDAFRLILPEKTGSFAFAPSPARGMPPNAERVGTLLVELQTTDLDPHDDDPISGRALHEHERPSATRSPE